jgi:hypothetical protein
MKALLSLNFTSPISVFSTSDLLAMAADLKSLAE